MKQLQYPIGHFQFNPKSDRSEWVQTIADLPNDLAKLTADYSSTDWALTYRPDGWNAKQLIHHIADSHMNSFIRCKLALTEDNPTIRPYLEDQWALLPDVSDVPAQVSLMIITGIHQRWVTLLNALSAEDYQKCFFHPEQNQKISLLENTAFYAWHSLHHLAHLKLIHQQIK